MNTDSDNGPDREEGGAPMGPDRDEKGGTRMGADLAFVKGLVGEGARGRMSGGAVFLAAGLCYGLQCLLLWPETMGWFHWGAFGMVLGIAPSVIFAAVLGYVLWTNRKDGQTGVATRAINAAFGSAGLANMFIVAVFAYLAFYVEKNMLIWLLYPAVVCAFQGAVWYIAYMIRRQLWLALVSGGWFITTLALGLLIRTPHYVLVLGLALTFLMGGSGYAMMRLAKKAETTAA